MDTDTNILIVDDIAQNLVAMEALLAAPGVRILKASSGPEALELLLVNEIALALIDVQMPQMDGFELATLIRGSERYRSVPLIFLTAATREPNAYFRGYEAGAVDFLYKPINNEVLQSKVQVFIELHRQKKQLSQQLTELQQAMKLIEMFTAVLGHDLRNPLAAIMNSAHLMLRQSDDEAVIKNAQRIQTSSRRMARMVEQLLDMARIRAGGIQLQPQQTDVEKLCREIVDEMQSDRDLARIEVHVRGDMQGEVDVDRFSQIISNLLGNAMQHGAADAPIVLELDGNQSGAIAVAVRNQGHIPQDSLPQLFEPFRSALEPQKQSPGLGLGLYIVKQFVDAHSGAIRVESSPQEGTAFHLNFPRKSLHTGSLPA